MAGDKKRGQQFKSEEIVYLIWLDLINGLTRYDIKLKLETDAYERDGYKTSDHKKSAHYNWITQAYDKAKYELQENEDKLRDLFYNRLTAVYNECMTAGDRQNGLKALDMMAKFGGLYTDNKKVELSGKVDSTITIDFGFDNGDESEV